MKKLSKQYNNMAIDLEKYKLKTDTPKVDLSKYKLPEPTPQAPEKKGIFGRLMDIPSKLKSEVETQSKATAQSLGEIGLAKKEGQDYGSTFLQYAGSAVRAGIVDPVVSIAKTGASLLTEGQKERGTKVLGDLAKPFVAGVGELSDKISNIPAIQKFSETPEASTLERNYEAIFNLSAILPVGEAKPLLKASGLGKAGTFVEQGAYRVADEVSDLSKAVFSKSEQQLEKSILTKFEKGVKPLLPGKTTPTQVNKYKTSVVDAVKTINENKNSLKFVTPEGEVISGQTPTSLQQFADSVEQTKKIIFTQYDALAQQSGKAGNVIDLTKVATELDTVINSKSLAISNPQAIVYAQKAKDNLLRFGSIDTATTQDVVQQMNARLQAFYRNPTAEGAGNSVIDAMIANSLRQEADTFITGLTGTEYGALKGQYGSLKAVEKDVIKANLRDARKNVKGLIDYTDIFTGADMIVGIGTMNPTHIASGAVMRGLKEYYKYVNNPNNIVKGMFKDVTKLSEKSIPVTSKNPLGDVGLSIKDISGKSNQSLLGKPNSSLQKTPQIKTPTIEKNAIPKPTTKATTESSLIQEARKYKSADDYGKAIKEKFIKEQGFEPSSMKVVDEWWQGKQTQPYIGIGGQNPDFFINKPTLAELPKSEISKYLKFTEDGKAIYYRGIPKDVETRAIRWGDFLSPDKGKASFYGKVEKYELDPKYIQQLGDLEAVYFNPVDKLKAPKTQSLKEIYNKAKGLGDLLK